MTAVFDRAGPIANSVFYSLNADTGQAHWASFDRQPDRWTSQFLSADPEAGTLSYGPVVCYACLSGC